MSQAATAAGTPGITPGSVPSPHSPTGAKDANLGFLDRHHFLLRRLHSLTGIVPVGVFVIFHLFTNAQIAFSTFEHEVGWIHSLPALLFLEVFGLWLPIGFHAALGIVYIFTGKRNTRAYPYGDNWRYALQRWTAWVSLAFIFFHVATLRWGWTFGVMPTPFYYPDPGVSANMQTAMGAVLGVDALNLASATTAMTLQHSPLVLLAYILGVYSVIFHWANGLWTAAITWGLTLSVASQKRWGYVCAAMGVVLSIFAALAIGGALAYEVTPAHKAAIVAYEAHLEHDALPDVRAMPGEEGGFILTSEAGTTLVYPDGRIQTQASE